jgi:hypothetical protein
MLYRGPGRVGISAGTPRGQPAGFRLYKALAPDREWLNEPIEIYQPLYEAKLAKLDPQQVWDDLHRLAGKDAAGDQVEPVMLCFERPPWTPINWCHRRMAAKFLEDSLGVSIPEVDWAADR